MKVLVLGASGLVGHGVYSDLSEVWDTYGTWNANKPKEAGNNLLHFDMHTAGGLAALLRKVRPDVVVSSLTGDFAAQKALHRELASCLAGGGRCVYISTANVFDGDPSRPHSVTDTPCPLSAYGRFKLECEQVLQGALGDRCLVARLPKVLSRTGTPAMLQAAQKEGAQVYANLFMGAVTPALVGEGIRRCVTEGRTGVVHLAAQGTLPENELYARLASAVGVVWNPPVAKCLTVAAYVEALGESDAAVSVEEPGKFYLALKSMRPNLPESLEISLEELVCTQLV